MKTSFQKAYERIENEDGSFDLKFDSKKSQCGGCVFAVSLCFSVLFWLYASNVVAAVATAIIFVVAYNIQNVNEKITVKPSEGVIFGSYQLPFADIQKIGTMNSVGGSSVLAVSHGKQIKLSGYLGESLADAIADELKAASGKKWS